VIMQSLRIPERNSGIFITSFAFIIYLATLSRNYMGDGIQFAMAIESEDLTRILLPNHMLYPLLGLWFYRICQFIGWQEGALFPLQILSAIGGALSVGLMYRIGGLITGSTRIAWLVAVGFGVSHGTWLYSTDAEAVTVPLASALLLLYLLMSNSDGSRLSRPVLLGLFSSLSIITYQTGVFLIVVVIVGFLMDVKLNARVRFRQILIFLFVTGFLVASIYLLVAFFVFGITNWEGLLDWQFRMSQIGLWGKPSLRNFVQGGYAFLRALAGYKGLGPGVRTTMFLAETTRVQHVVFGIYYAIVLVIASLPLFIAVVIRRHILHLHRKNVAIIVTWGVLYGAFAIYWVSGDVQFWMPVLVSWWLLVGILLKMSTDPDIEFGRAPEKFRLQFHKITGLVIVVFLLCNLFSTILLNLDPRFNRSYQIAISVKEHTSSDDLIVTTGGDALFLNIPYFGERQTVSLYHQILFGNRDKDNAFDDVNQRILQVRLNGGHAYLVGVQPGQDVWWDSLQEIGLTKEDFSRFKTEHAWQVFGEDVLEIVP